MIISTDKKLSYLSFPNGLRGVHLQLPRKPVGIFGVAIRAGSSDEDTAENLDGLAHFVEHTIFKGTLRRSSFHIINRMEAVGGELNAFTSKDDTVVYTVFPHGNLYRGIELISDLIQNSQFPQHELEKERQVVADEINSYLDSPADAVFDDFEDLIFKGTPYGHNILGNIKSLRNFNSDVCRNWVKSFYHPGRMVVFYAGNVGVERFDMAIQRFFCFDNGDTGITASSKTATYFPVPAFDVCKRVRGNHQSHTICGTCFPAPDDSTRTSMAMLSNILGGPGMNSLLNVELRERRGLVYNVETSTSLFGKNGLFTIYFGCDPDDREKCMQIIYNQLQRLSDKPLTARQLSAAKKQYLGQLLVANENHENLIISIARATLMRGKALTTNDITNLINDTTSQSLMLLSQKISSLSALSLTP